MGEIFAAAGLGTAFYLFFGRAARKRPGAADFGWAVLAGTAAAVCASLVDRGGEFWERAVFSGLLGALSSSDVRDGILPHELTLGGIAVGLAAGIADGEFLVRFLSASAAWGIFALALAARPGSFGGGDGWMAGMIGAFVGEGVFLALALGGTLGGAVGLVLAKVKKKSWRGFCLPFGPFLAAAAAVVGI